MPNKPLGLLNNLHSFTLSKHFSSHYLPLLSLSFSFKHFSLSISSYLSLTLILLDLSLYLYSCISLPLTLILLYLSLCLYSCISLSLFHFFFPSFVFLTLSLIYYFFTFLCLSLSVFHSCFFLAFIHSLSLSSVKRLFLSSVTSFLSRHERRVTTLISLHTCKTHFILGYCVTI